jgi:hypothetical protein
MRCSRVSSTNYQLSRREVYPVAAVFRCEDLKMMPQSRADSCHNNCKPALFFRVGSKPGCSLRQLCALSLLTQRHPCSQKRRDVRFYDYSTLPVVATRREGGSCPSVRAVAPPRSRFPCALSSAIWPGLPRYVVGTEGKHGVGDDKKDLTGTHGLYRNARHMIAHCCRPSRREICPSQTGLSIFKARSVAFRPRPSHVTLCLFPTTSLNPGVEGTRQT